MVSKSAGFKFSGLLLSYVTADSNLYWVHFIFVYCFTFWVMWLLVKYYQARRAARPHGCQELVDVQR